MDFMHSKGKIDLRSILTGPILPTTLYMKLVGPTVVAGTPE